LDELFESFHRPGSLNFRGTLSVYQLFITYLWWLYYQKYYANLQLVQLN